MSKNSAHRDRLPELLHELRQPLNAICLVTANIVVRTRNDHGDLYDAYLKRKLEIISESLERASSIIDKIEVAQSLSNQPE